jgi:hypothetical protein
MSRTFANPRSRLPLRCLGFTVLMASGQGCAMSEPAAETPEGRDLDVQEAHADGAPAAADAGEIGEGSAAEDASAAAAEDAGVKEDAGSAEDASATEDADAVEDAAARGNCEHDRECAPSEYCARAGQGCRTRCDERHVCVGPTIAATNNRVVSDGMRVCYADDGDLPDGHAYALKVWDGIAAQATTLTVATDARALLLDDGYCYFHAAAAIRRAPLNGGCVELVREVSTPPQRIWASPEGVSWSETQAGQVTTYRLPRTPNAQAELLGTASEQAGAAPLNDGGVSDVSSYRTFAVLDQRLIYQPGTEGRLAVAPVALAPMLSADAGSPAP